MVSFFGDYDLTETVHIPFNTFTSDDPSASCTITNLVAGDVEIHKDGSAVQRASDNGVTVSIDFDGITGNHMIHIDLSDNSDAGFYATGSRYQVRIEGTTIDGGTVNAWIGAFSIGCTLRPTTAGRTLDVAATGEAGLDFDNVKDATGAHTLTNITIPVVTNVGTCTTNSDMRGTDNAALASVLGVLNNVAADGDPTDADTVMQYIKQLINILIGTTGIANFPNEAAPANNVSLAEVIRAIHADVTGLNGDAMRGTDGANTTVPDAAGTAAALHAVTDAAIAVIDGIVDNIVADTNELQTDWANGGRLDLLIDELTTQGDTNEGKLDVITTDTNELQTDLTDGGRLDLFIDAIKTVTDALNAAQSEPTGVPAANATPLVKLATLYMMARNKITVTASKKTYYDDGDAAEFEKDLNDDDTTYTESEVNAV
jgi:hypothetical protein